MIEANELCPVTTNQSISTSLAGLIIISRNHFNLKNIFLFNYVCEYVHR